jgi:5-dehydro-2-deoxygluconokinase
MIEALVIGRVGVDLTPAMPRTTLAEADSFVRAVGGFAGNIATGLARLGIGTAVISAVGADGHGDHVRTFLAGEGIDVGPILTRSGSLTQVAFFEVWPPEHFPVTFYRPAPPAEMQLRVAELPTELLERTPLVIVSGTLLAGEPARSTVFGILEDRRAARRGPPVLTTILDLDWRPTLWGEPAEARALVERAAGLSDILIGSDDEFDAVGLRPEVPLATEGRPSRGGATPDLRSGVQWVTPDLRSGVQRVTPDLRSGVQRAHPRPSLGSPLGPAIVVLKHGRHGVTLITGDGRDSHPGIAVEVLCGIGAGDALTAAFAAGLLRGLDPSAAVERGNAAGAIVATRLMCSTAMPTPAEIDELLARLEAGPQEVLP